MNTQLDRILGVLYGQAIGDAMGMPPELWGRKRLANEYPQGICSFLDGNPVNAISYNYKKAQFTDDTAQAIIILDSLFENDFQIAATDLAKRLIDWAIREDAFAKNLLGPTSKMVLQCYIDGADPTPYSKTAVTNGAAMRVSPVGTLFKKGQKKALCDYVAAITKVTHSSDIAIASACMPAMAIASLIDGCSWDEMLEAVMSIEDYARSLGIETVSPYISDRLLWGISLAKKHKDDPLSFSHALYRSVGAGVSASETVPAALSIAYYCRDVRRAAIMCANLGGDTDTIGAIACAVCGAANGLDSIPAEYIHEIEQANHIDFHIYGEKLAKKRGEISV